MPPFKNSYFYSGGAHMLIGERYGCGQLIVWCSNKNWETAYPL
jgi:hypothetical protein